MAYEISKGDDGIIRLAFAGDINQMEMEAFRKELDVFLSTEQPPVSILVDSTQPSKFTSAARRILRDVQASSKDGKSAIVGANRYSRVLVRFVVKASGRDNIRFFDTNDEALRWLKEKD